jgi:type IV secretory pathway VirB10-like protein
MKQNNKWNAIWKYIHALVFCIKIPCMLSSLLHGPPSSLPRRCHPRVKRCRQPSQPPRSAASAPALGRPPPIYSAEIRERKRKETRQKGVKAKKRKGKKRNPDTSSSRRSKANKEAFSTDAAAVICFLHVECVTSAAIGKEALPFLCS